MTATLEAPHRIVALVGRRDEPTDAIRAYCSCLGKAFAAEGVEFEMREIAWADDGWLKELRKLWRAARGWDSKHVLLLQYTVLAWSRRGFPFGLFFVSLALRLKNVPFAIVYHDPVPFGGTRVIDRVRRGCQKWVMRAAAKLANWTVLTLPKEKVEWLPAEVQAVFIPVGANIPPAPASMDEDSAEVRKIIAVFGVTGGAGMAREAAEIAAAVRQVRQAPAGVHILLFGRNSLEAEPILRRELSGSGITSEALGLLELEDISAAFSRVHVALFVRGGISTRRGSALAAIACGVPIAAYEGAETSFPITEAGVLIAPYGDCVGLGHALDRILGDGECRRQLRERSRAAQDAYFAWPVIARSFLKIVAGENG